MNNKVETALALTAKYGVARKEPARQNLVIMPRVCAVHGLAFVALYEALPNGHYRLKDCERANGSGSVGGTMKQIDLNLIESRWLHPEKCPWCGDYGIIYCTECKRFVCGGRTKGNDFTCAPDCGCHGKLSGEYTSFTGVSEPPAAAPRASGSPQLAGTVRAALPLVNALKLGSGKR